MNLSQLKRITNTNFIEPEHNDKTRYRRAIAKLRESVRADVQLGPAYVHVLLRDPSMWVRDDVEKATDEDWEFIEELERRKLRQAGLVAPHAFAPPHFVHMKPKLPNVRQKPALAEKAVSVKPLLKSKFEWHSIQSN